MAVQKNLVFFPEGRVTAILTHLSYILQSLDPELLGSLLLEVHSVAERSTVLQLVIIFTQSLFYRRYMFWIAGEGGKTFFLPEMPSCIFINHSRLKGWAEM